MEGLSEAVKFQYSSLPAEGWIRLLTVKAGMRPLSCTIQAVAFDDSTQSYEAISYAWGHDADTNQVLITCNNCAIAIGANLALALTHIRHPGVDKVVWADAICINQQDTEERSLQVRQMAKIYGSARCVLIWLGKDRGGDAKDCLRLMRRTNRLSAELLLKHGNVESIPSGAYNEDLVRVGPVRWDAIRHLMQASWFTRVWTLQEVGLARRATVMYGNAAMSFSELVEFMLLVAARHDLGSLTGDVKSGLVWDVFDDIWRPYAKGPSWTKELPYMQILAKQPSYQTFPDLLNVTRPFEATDPRDRIYALLSHPAGPSATEHDSPVITIDYNKTVDQVYAAVASQYVCSTRYPWTVLSCVDHTFETPALQGLRPSWVPYWNEGWRVYWLGYALMWYRAGGNSNLSFDAKVVADYRLQVRGVVVDTIDWTSDKVTSEALYAEFQERKNPIGQLWKALEQSGMKSRYGGAKDCEIAFSLVTVAGRAADEGPADEDLTLHTSVYDLSQSILYCNEPKPQTAISDTHDKSQQLEVTTLVVNQRRALHNRRLFRTATGYYGVCHFSVRQDDVCCVFPGANVPFVLRAVTQNNDASNSEMCYRLVGESYVQGIMKGEIIDEFNKGNPQSTNMKLRNIVIV